MATPLTDQGPQLLGGRNNPNTRSWVPSRIWPCERVAVRGQPAGGVRPCTRVREPPGHRNRGARRRTRAAYGPGLESPPRARGRYRNDPRGAESGATAAATSAPRGTITLRPTPAYAPARGTAVHTHGHRRARRRPRDRRHARPPARPLPSPPPPTRACADTHGRTPVDGRSHKHPAVNPHTPSSWLATGFYSFFTRTCVWRNLSKATTVVQPGRPFERGRRDHHRRQCHHHRPGPLPGPT